MSAARRRPHFRVYHPAGLILLLISLAGVVLVKTPSRQVQKPPVVDVDADYADIGVTHVYDGDTIRLDNGAKVRLIGIDTPESSRNKKLLRDAERSGEDIETILRMGAQAAAYARSLLTGRRVRLEFDLQTHDKYGRLLAYVYRIDDGLFVNEAIIHNGYAYPMTIPPNIRYADMFKDRFREARASGRGLWAGDVTEIDQ